LRVSVIATVFNEAASIDALIASLCDQSRPPDEIVIVDGGSQDGTLDRLGAWASGSPPPPWKLRPAGESYPQIRCISAPGANISAGRNLAIAAATGPIIAATDAGVRLVDGWLEALLVPFGDGARVVAGFFGSDPQGAFETALGAATLPEAREIDPENFLPSSRSVAFLKSDWQAIGGYPEWLDYCEDLVFDLRLRALAGPAHFAPRALALFRPRPDPIAFWKQYYRYARGDGKAGLWPLRHALRYLTYGLAIPGLLIAGWRLHPLAWLLLALGLVGMLRRGLRRLPRQWQALSPPARLLALAWLPAIRVMGDLAKICGYPAGLIWRLRERPPDWNPRAIDLNPSP
jgi:glycosyltransferase involved in cell wall biosynthesis